MDITTRFNVGEIIQINKQRAIDTFERLLPIGLKQHAEDLKRWGHSSDDIKKEIPERETDARNKFYLTLNKILDKKFIVVRFDIMYRWNYKGAEVATTTREYLEKFKNKNLEFFYRQGQKTVLRKWVLDDEHCAITGFFFSEIWTVLTREELYDVVGVHKEE